MLQAVYVAVIEDDVDVVVSVADVDALVGVFGSNRKDFVRGGSCNKRSFSRRDKRIRFAEWRLTIAAAAASRRRMRKRSYPPPICDGRRRCYLLA